MLTVYTAAGAVPLQIDDYYIKELASGLDELIFSMSIWTPEYQQIQEETSIREESDDGAALYLVKAIDGGSDRAQIKCQLDLDDWRSVMVMDYKSESAKVGDIVASVAPTGWEVADDSGLTYRRTITLDAATPMDVLEQCRSTFPEVTFRFDTIGKTVTIVNMDTGENLGAFATRELNLKRNDYKGKSTNFATRLYAYGKDGLSFASINGGKPYVENHSYSSRVICAPVWIDERYTVAENLLRDAQARLDTLAVPQRSFDCDVVDLAATDPERFSFLSFPLFSVAALIDDTRSAGKIDHKIVERWRYPYAPEKNKVVFSTVAPRIQSQVTQVIRSITNV
ncbi:MAG: phage tail protein, partial [Oscillospiraceae bacterium]|nr:phage tail protein [Oscillospiraceae bacterium]